MKFTIEGLQQTKLVEWKLDCIDAVIIRYLIDFYATNKMEKLQINGIDYFWIKYSKILKDLPILKIKKEAVSNRFKKLVKCHLLIKREVKNNDGTKIYFRFTSKKLEELLTIPNSTQEKTRVRTQEKTRMEYNNYSIKKDNILLSKDNSERFPEKTKVYKSSIFLETWNSLKEKFPMIRQHKNPSSKIYQTSARRLKRLMKGSFGKFVSLSPSFMANNFITKKHLDKKWTEKEILKGLKLLPYIYVEGYWPQNKKRLPKNLADLIYNPGLFNTKIGNNGGTSWLLMVMIKGVHKLGEVKPTKAVESEIKAKTKPIEESKLEDFKNACPNKPDKQYGQYDSNSIGCEICILKKFCRAYTRELSKRRIS